MKMKYFLRLAVFIMKSSKVFVIDSSAGLRIFPELAIILWYYTTYPEFKCDLFGFGYPENVEFFPRVQGEAMSPVQAWQCPC